MRFGDLFDNIEWKILEQNSVSEEVAIIDSGSNSSVRDNSIDNIDIQNICQDSRVVTNGSIFFALHGHVVDGRKYIDDAINNGAIAIVMAPDVDATLSKHNFKSVPVVVVANPRRVLAIISQRFFCETIDEPLIIGVTGTNGKTSVVWLLSHSLSMLSAPSVYIGTLGMMLFDSTGRVVLSSDVGATTPDPVSLWRFIGKACSLGAKFVVMEASSHALVQDRVFGINWSVGVFTNLTRDHLDYHGTLEDYAQAKKLLFSEGLGCSRAEKRFAVINAADAVGRSISEWVLDSGRGIELIRFGSCDALVPVRSRDVGFSKYDADVSGLYINIKSGDCEFEISSLLVGAYNVENLLTAASVLLALGYPARDVGDVLGKVGCVPGRLERVKCHGAMCNVENESPLPSVFVDYAHTPDALQKALKSLREITSGRLIIVFGCGGNRDRGKRPLMGEAVAKFSDIGIVTTDNPRCEKPEDIIDDVLPGLKNFGENVGFSYHIEVDRTAAIRLAIKLASKNDVVLVAGKGHENYQEINSVKYPYSDVEKCREVLESSLFK